MCDPISMMAASMAITAVSAGVGYMGQQQAAQQQEAAIRANVNANQTQTQVQQNQVNEQSTQQMSERARQAMIARGHAMAVFADAGGGGNSQGRVMSDIGFSEGQDMATLEANRRSALQQTQFNSAAGVRQANGQLASIQQPSLLGVGLQIAGAGVDSYNKFGKTDSLNVPTQARADPWLTGGFGT